MMYYLARDIDGRTLIGDDGGYVPLSAAEPSLGGIDDILGHRPADLPDLDKATARRIPAAHIEFARPLSATEKVFGIGLNYADHAADLDEDSPDEPASFFKPTTAVTGPGGPIRLPPRERSDRVTAEAELALVVGQTCRDVDVGDAAAVVAGFLPVIDVTAEDVLRRNPRFLTRAKSFDTFLVLGPRIAVSERGVTLEDRSVRTVVNDEIVAENRIGNMHFSPQELVAFHSGVMTLERGDVITTGTPGAGRIEPGDRVRAVVDGVGSVAADVVR